MFSINQIDRSVQRYICMALSVVIVASMLWVSGYAAQVASRHEGYSVTITQVQ
jgi:ABC-type proline/glycine betaine transport system permease subunit